MKSIAVSYWRDGHLHMMGIIFWCRKFDLQCSCRTWILMKHWFMMVYVIGWFRTELHHVVAVLCMHGQLPCVCVRYPLLKGWFARYLFQASFFCKPCVMIQMMMISPFICCCGPHLSLYQTMCLPTEKTALVAQAPPLPQDLHRLRLRVRRFRQWRHVNHQVRGNAREREKGIGRQIAQRKMMIKMKFKADLTQSNCVLQLLLGGQNVFALSHIRMVGDVRMTT